MLPVIVDSHAHVFPELLGRWIPQSLKKRARGWLKPLSTSLHRTQPFVRILPKTLCKPLDELGGIAPLPQLLIESSPADFQQILEEHGVWKALIIAHEPYIPNEFILETCEEKPQFVPVINMPPETKHVAKSFKDYVRKGARALKIHPASDGEGADSPRYKNLLRLAANYGLPVIVHTGCFHSHILYRDPHLGKAERFAPWFKTYPETAFVLAHMNLHDPSTALDLVEKFSNVYVDTSWQPAETIGEAVRRGGADRVLFGTDWPFVGNNVSVGLKRIQEAIEAELLSNEHSQLILGGNAVKLFKLQEPHASPAQSTQNDRDSSAFA